MAQRTVDSDELWCKPFIGIRASCFVLRALHERLISIRSDVLTTGVSLKISLWMEAVGHFVIGFNTAGSRDSVMDEPG